MTIKSEAAMRGRTARKVDQSHGVSDITASSQSANGQAPAPCGRTITVYGRKLEKGARPVLLFESMTHQQREGAYLTVITLLAGRSGKCQLRTTLSYNIGFRFGFKLDLVKRNSRLMVLLVTSARFPLRFGHSTS